MKNTSRTFKNIGTGVRKEECIIDKKKKFVPLPHQERLKNYFLKSPHRGLLLYHELGSGKCHKIDTPIMLNDGKIKMVQDIEVGDLLMGDDSTPRTVTSLARGEDEMYEIIPTKGDSYTVNQEHILCLKASGYPQFNHVNDKYNTNYNIQYIENNKFMSRTFSYKRNDIDDEEKKKIEAENFFNNISHDTIMEISVIEFLKLSKIKKACLKTYRVPVDFPEQKVTIDPYMIGYWLGDSSKRGSVITTQDSSVIHYFKKELSTYNLSLNYRYGISGFNGKPNSNIFLTSLKENNLINNKHIPDIYKYNSRENRLKLLAGLIDSDGSLSNGCFDFSQFAEKEKLFDDVMYLARSLGFACYKSKKKCSYKDKNGNMIKKDVWRMNISGTGIEEIPTKIPRKQAKVRKQIKDVLVSGIEVKHVGRDNYYGFTLDGNCRYLLGDFTVTHNTCTSIIIAEEMLESKKIKRVFVCTPGSLRKNFTYEYCNLCGIKDNLKKYYIFVTYNTNIFNTIKKTDFNDSLVIIDEAHNLINGAKNITLNPYSLYNQILNSNAKVLILSGTVIYNNVYEWAILGNLLKKDAFPNIIKKGVLEKQLFENNIDEIFSKEKLEGIISYYQGNQGDYPQVIYHDPIRVLMTEKQSEKWDSLSKAELILQKKGPPTHAEYRENPVTAHYEHILYVLAMKNIFTRAISNVHYLKNNMNRRKLTKEESVDVYTSLPYPLKKSSIIKTQLKKNKPDPITIESIVLKKFNIIAPTYKHIIEINDTTLENIVDEIIKRLIVSKFVSYYELDREMIKEILRNKIEEEKIANTVEDDIKVDSLIELEQEILHDEIIDEETEEIINKDVETMYDMCNLCLEPLKGQKNLIYQLPCGDIFHFDCLKIYLKNKERKCPTCKSAIDGKIEKKYAKKYSYVNVPDTLRNDDGTGGWIYPGFFDNKLLTQISPKILTIILNILENYESKHVIFSYFLEKAGLRLINSLFEMCGIKSILYHGDLKPELKENYIKQFNSKNNMYGNKFKVFLSTESGFEGITLKDVGHVHFLETNPLANKTSQAIGRAVRYKSHVNLPEDKRVVNIWKYFATPVTYEGSIPDFNTTDSNLTTFEQYYNYYVKSNSKNILGSEYGIHSIGYGVGTDELLSNKNEYKLREFEKFYDILKENSIESQDRPHEEDGMMSTVKLHNTLNFTEEDKISQNILYLCANDETSNMEIPKGQKYINEKIKNPHKNYYIGVNLDLTLEDEDNKCKLIFGEQDIDICKFKVLFDIIVLEFCPVGFLKRFFTDKFFDDINKILSPNGIIVIPLVDNMKYLGSDVKIRNERNSIIEAYFEHNNFELSKIKQVEPYGIYIFKRKESLSQIGKKRLHSELEDIE